MFTMYEKEIKMYKQRVNLIKSMIASKGIKQVDIAQELGISVNTIWCWINGKFTSKRITQYFGDKFGESFLKQIEIH